MWEELLRRWDALGRSRARRAEIAGLRLKRLPEVGRYYYRGEEVVAAGGGRAPVAMGVGEVRRRYTAGSGPRSRAC